MARIERLATDEPQVALIVAAHNAAVLDGQGDWGPTGGGGQGVDPAAAYIERFRRIYQALAATVGIEEVDEDDEDDEGR